MGTGAVGSAFGMVQKPAAPAFGFTLWLGGLGAPATLALAFKQQQGGGLFGAAASAPTMGMLGMQPAADHPRFLYSGATSAAPLGYISLLTYLQERK